MDQRGDESFIGYSQQYTVVIYAVGNKQIELKVKTRDLLIILVL